MKNMFAIALVFLVTNVHAQVATWVSAGTNDGSGSFSVGGRGERFGIELGGLLNGELSSDEVLDYPVPHNSYRNLGEKRVDGSWGLDFLIFHNFTKSVSIYGGVGAYFSDIREIAQSTVTGWYYTQKDNSGVEGAVSAGFQFFPTEKLMLGVGFHSIRGPNFQLGLSF